MRMYDLIEKKRDGHELSDEEIRYIVEGFTEGDIPDYQMSAFLMAVYYKGMNDREILTLTMAMVDSGDTVDLSSIEGVKADKHSTGGVGDKTSLIVAPIAAANGIKVAKMSGRGLGHTGGTVDKLESIPGYRTDLDEHEFFETVRRTGLSIIGQTGNLTPADKKMYALRDVTATVDSIPLIASSIMSKKIAAGSDCILLDVKVGSGAFMKNTEDAVRLAEVMVSIGENAGRRTKAMITDMDTPLGYAIGNSLEVIEAVDTLRGRGPEDLTDECIGLAANLMAISGLGDEEHCTKLAKASIDDGSALDRLIAMVDAQGGDTSVILDTDRFAKAAYTYDILSKTDGYITSMDAAGCGIASSMLGAGRENLESKIDHTAGIILKKKTGDRVAAGEVLATLKSNDEGLFKAAADRYTDAIEIGDVRKKRNPLVYALVSRDKIIRLEK